MHSNFIKDHMFLLVLLLMCTSVYCSASESTRSPEAIAARKTLAATKMKTDPVTVYKDFNNFCKLHYGAEKEDDL